MNPASRSQVNQPLNAVAAHAIRRPGDHLAGRARARAADRQPAEQEPEQVARRHDSQRLPRVQSEQHHGAAQHDVQVGQVGGRPHHEQRPRPPAPFRGTFDYTDVRTLVAAVTEQILGLLPLHGRAPRPFGPLESLRAARHRGTHPTRPG